MILTVLKKTTKQSVHGGFYTRITFKDEKGKWYKTDLVGGFRNYNHWRKVLSYPERTKICIPDWAIGEEQVDADCEPKIVFIPPEETKPAKQIQLKLGGVE